MLSSDSLTKRLIDLMCTVVSGKRVSVALGVLSVLVAATLIVPPLGTNSGEKMRHSTSDAHRASSQTTAVVPPPAPRPPLHTPSDVLIEADSTLELPDRLPITPSSTPGLTDASKEARLGASRSASPDTAHRAIASTAPDTMRAAPLTRSDSTRLKRLAELAEALSSDRTSDAQPSAPAERSREPSAFASAVAGTIPEDAADGPGITGLVTDETRTKVGRDFYDAFYDRWESPEKDFYYTVVVSEQPMPSLGTRVVVRLNQNVVFQTRLQPRSDVIEQAARRAVFLTQRRLQSNPSINVY